jgi:hypothetical protein
MCGAHETFYDWSTHQGRALCETTSVTWRFLQPFLKRFSWCPICGANLYQCTFSMCMTMVLPVFFFLCIHVLRYDVQHQVPLLGVPNYSTFLNSNIRFSRHLSQTRNHTAFNAIKTSLFAPSTKFSTVALIECASRKCFEYSKHPEK